MSRHTCPSDPPCPACMPDTEPPVCPFCDDEIPARPGWYCCDKQRDLQCEEAGLTQCPGCKEWYEGLGDSGYCGECLDGMRDAKADAQLHEMRENGGMRI